MPKPTLRGPGSAVIYGLGGQPPFQEAIMSVALTQSAGFFRVIGHALYSFASAIGHGLVRMAEAGPRMQAIGRLNAMSDEELEAKGVTREEMVRRIFGASFYA
jgi:hypothetical protein